MKKVQIEDWLLHVYVEKTKEAFALNRYACVSDECENFINACTAIPEIVLDFAEQLGIDLSKPSLLTCHQVENNEAVMYSGQYHIIGDIIAGEVDAWDVVVGEHCFSLSQEFSNIPSVMGAPIIEISFEVVLPWVLEKV